MEKENSIESNDLAKKPPIDPNLLDPSKSMWKPIIIFLIPMMLSNFLQSISGIISAAIIGRGLGEVSLAAVSTIMPVNFFLISLVIGLSSGSLVLIGQAYGAGKADDLRKTVDTTLKFSFVLGFIMALIGCIWIDQILHWISVPPTVFPEAKQFGLMIFVSFPLLFVYISYTTILRGTGDSKTPFWFLVISTVLTVILTPILTFGWLGLPALGVVGAGLSSILATLISFVLLIFYLKYTNHPLALRKTFWQSLRIDPVILKLLLKIGFPSGIQMIAISLSEIAVVFLVNGHGPQATAAYGAVLQVLHFVQMPMLSLGMAAGVFASQFIGAKASERLPALLKHTLIMNYVLGIVLVGAIYLASDWVLLGFLEDPATIAIAKEVLMAVLWALMLFGHGMILSSLMRGTGTVLIPTVITIGCIWILLVPVAALLSEPLGLLGIWLAYPISDAAMLMILYLYYRFVWKRKQHQSVFAS